jgi:hypothetical protein
VGEWSFFTNHARVLICIANDPGLRLRDLAAALGITERSAYGTVADLVQAGYVVKNKDGRRNRYRVEGHLPLPEPLGRERTIGEILVLLVEVDARRPPRAVRNTRPPAIGSRSKSRSDESPSGFTMITSSPDSGTTPG